MTRTQLVFIPRFLEACGRLRTRGNLQTALRVWFGVGRWTRFVHVMASRKLSFHFTAYPPGFDKAVQLARAWTRKCNYFYAVWEEKGDLLASYEFTDDDIAAYEESEEFIDWACSLDIEDVAFGRVHEYREFRPT